MSSFKIALGIICFLICFSSSAADLIPLTPPDPAAPNYEKEKSEYDQLSYLNYLFTANADLQKKYFELIAQMRQKEARNKEANKKHMEEMKSQYPDYPHFQETEQDEKPRSLTSLLSGEYEVDKTIAQLIIFVEEKNNPQITGNNSYFQRPYIGSVLESIKKDYPPTPVRPDSSSTCHRFLLTKNFLNGTDETTFAHNENQYKFSTYKNRETGAIRPDISLIDPNTQKEKDLKVEFVEKKPGKISYFQENGKLYQINTNAVNTYFNISEFDPAHNFMKDACFIFSAPADYDIESDPKDLPVCQNVTQGKYALYGRQFVKDLMTDTEFKEYQKHMCTIAMRMNDPVTSNEEKTKKEQMWTNCLNIKNTLRFPLKANRNSMFVEESVGGFEGYKLDYNNDGKDDIVLSGFYALGIYFGCNAEILYAYDKNIKTHIETVSKKFKCRDGEQRLIKIGNKNYVLLMQFDMPNKLFEITFDNGQNQEKQICAFTPKLNYY
ncbi:MAG: hypothetical protein LBU87_00220 [Lactobacillales bacterium]|jgi:hypothetical protein|nr:hypothetical protein [Lactobacillales bacterium]